MIAAFLLAAADLTQVKAAYDSCIVSQAVRLGADNQESADTILRAVRSVCTPQWDALQASIPGGSGVPLAEQMRAHALIGWRSEAEDAAVAALLEARAKRP